MAEQTVEQTAVAEIRGPAEFRMISNNGKKMTTRHIVQTIQEHFDNVPETQCDLVVEFKSLWDGIVAYVQVDGEDSGFVSISFDTIHIEIEEHVINILQPNHDDYHFVNRRVLRDVPDENNYLNVAVCRDAILRVINLWHCCNWHQ